MVQNTQLSYCHWILTFAVVNALQFSGLQRVHPAPSPYAYTLVTIQWQKITHKHDSHIHHPRYNPLSANYNIY